MLLDHILSRLRRETLDILQAMTQAKKKKTWLTTYLVSFILLHNVALITKHDKEYAEKHRMEDRTKVTNCLLQKQTEASRLDLSLRLTGIPAQKQRLIWARADMVKQYHLGKFHSRKADLLRFTMHI